MRKSIFAAALFALSVLPAGVIAQPDMDSSDTHVIHVATRSGGGPVVKHLTLALDKAEIVELDADARDVLVSNPEIVDAVVRTPRRIFLLAMKTGQTNAFFFDGAGHQLLSIEIRVERDVTDLATMLHSDLPDSHVKVAALNDNVVLSGSVADAIESQRAQDLAARFAGGADKVVNMLQVNAHDQVMLKVRVAEVQREVAKQLGVDLQGAVNAAGVPLVASTANPFGLNGTLSALSGFQVGAACAAGALTLPMTGTTNPCTGPNNIQGVVKALEQVGLIHILAEPNLTAVSGETAKFLAGGEFPVPVSRDQFGNIVVEFKQFGVGLSFTPVVMSENRISLQISTEVSELTNTGAFTQQASGSSGSAFTIPALAVRRAETTVELPSGGSFAIAGLLQHTTKQEIDAFPGLTDIPVLGALFRSRDFQNNETELVVIVTAYMVNPTAEANLATPGDGFAPPADPEAILLGRLNAVYKHNSAGLKTAGNPIGYIVQ